MKMQKSLCLSVSPMFLFQTVLPYHLSGVVKDCNDLVLMCPSKFARSKTRLPLAGPAQRQARAAANHIYNIPNKNNNVIGSSVIRAFDYNAATTGKVLGAQAIGKGNVDKRIDVIATAILMEATVEELTESDLAYAPLFSTPRNAVNQASLVATNLINKRFRQIPVTEVCFYEYLAVQTTDREKIVTEYNFE